MRETQFVTFYSYKGGVGRTMALGNIAWEAALRGKRVVIIDFDLEAPGIPSLIPFRARVKEHLKDKNKKGGLFELILYFQKHKLVPSMPDFYSTEPIIDDDFETGGEIYIVPAGYEDSNYKDKLQSFDWDRFYEQEDGAELFNGLRDEIKFQFDNPDLVLIDSRTGLTDIGGICTLLIPDKVVVLTGLNDQNICGCKAVIDTIEKYSGYREEEKFLKPIEIILVASHVPDGDELALYEERLKHAEKIFKRSIDVTLPYVAALSLEERILIQVDGRQKVHSITLVERYRMLYSFVVNQQKEILWEYLKSVVMETKRIDMKGIYSRTGASREAIHFPIEEIYTPLKTHKSGIEKEPLREFDTMSQEWGERVPLTDLLSEHRRLLIIGEPGGGKTTFLKFIACVLAKDVLGETEGCRRPRLGMSLSVPAPVPVFMRLASLAEMIKKSSLNVGGGASWRYIEKAMEHIWGRGQSELLQGLLSEGRCALLLDGLDEVADEKLRNQIVDVVNSTLEYWGKNLIVLSSRPFGYHAVTGLEQMVMARVDTFGEKEILDFLDKWKNGLYQDSEDRKGVEYLNELRKAIMHSSPIRKLAHNPVMLTCLCVVHWNERKLPEGKADLLAAVLRWLLNAKQDKRKNRRYTNTFAEECFKALAFAMTCHQDGKQVIVDLAWAADKLRKPFGDILGIQDNGQVQRQGRAFLEEEMLDSGIVEKQGTGQLRFWHLNFQEHFAARALMDRSDDVWWKIIETKLYDRQWSEIIDHFSGCLAWTGMYRLNLLVEKILGTRKQDDVESIARVVGVLGRILRILAVYDNYQPPLSLGWEDACNQLMGIFEVQGAQKVPIEQRIKAVEALGQGGDPRIDVGHPALLPIPGMLDTLLGKYPVTVAEYQCFVDNKGYYDQRYWKDGWDIKQKSKWEEPGSWEEQLEYSNRPVVYISWYEVRAYCSWLSEQTGDVYRLPSEIEWHEAAKNPKGEYPWGNEDSDEERLNFDENVGCPTPVGVYPAGATLGGHLDMSGNVWEWCKDKWRDDENSVSSDGSARDDVQRNNSCVACGGSWSNGANLCQSQSRTVLFPEYRYGYIGFRLCSEVTINL